MEGTLNFIRLAGFPLALGLTGTLVLGTLNRVLIVEVGLSNFLVGLLLTGTYLLLTPFRAWIGHRSDAYPVLGLRREPYIIAGAIVSGVGVIAAVLLAFGGEALGVGTLAGMFAAFFIYGAGKHAASNTFEALQADKFTGDARPRAVNVLKVVLITGSIFAGVALGSLLEDFGPARFIGVVVAVVGVALALTIIAIIRQEPRQRRAEFTAASQQARQTGFVQAMRDIVLPDPRVRTFFLLVSLTVFGALAQELFLEPFGALALGMDVSQTARLQSIWGTGVILTLLAGGMYLIKRVGTMRVLRLGAAISVIAFIGLIIAGAMGSTGLFMGMVFVVGLGGGFAMSGIYTAAVEFTTTVRAGLLMGLWGIATELGETVGSLGGGLIVDIGNALTGSAYLVTYGLLFALEAAAMVAAFVLSRRVDLKDSTVMTNLAAEAEGVSAALGAAAD